MNGLRLSKVPSTPCDQPAALGRVRIDVGQRGKAVGQRRLAVHGDGMSSAPPAQAAPATMPASASAPHSAARTAAQACDSRPWHDIEDSAERRFGRHRPNVTWRSTATLVAATPSTAAALITDFGRIGLYLAAQLGYQAAGASVTLLPYSASKDR